MSSVAGAAAGAGAARPVPQRAPGAAASRLRMVHSAGQGTKASSGAFVLLLAGLLGMGLLGLLAVNMTLAQESFAATDLSRRQAALSDTEQQLAQQVAQLQSPQQLAASARALGMVGTTNPVFIDPVTGRVLGVPQVARRPYVAPTPSATASASPSPTGAATKPAAKPSTRPSAGASKPATTAPTLSPHPHTSPTPVRTVTR